MALTFALSWNNNSFDRTSSSAVDLFLTSNLLCRSWIPLGRFVLPVRTNEFEISVNTDNVSADAMSSFINSFHVGTAFFRFGLDVDSDGDSLTDAFESWTLGTSPFNSDTDLDGIDDNVEIRCSMDPLNPDSDGDGYSDGEEMLRGQNPLSYDSGSSITIRYYYDDDDRLTQTHAGANEASTEIKITPAGNFYVISDR